MVKKLQLNLEQFRENYARLQAEIENCASRGGYSQPPKIIVVSKYLEPSDTQKLIENGIAPLGENRADDLKAKCDPGPDREHWHFIGHVQRNKIRHVLPRTSMLHSLDSERLASSANEWQSEFQANRLHCLVQVNIAGEQRKGGLSIDQALEQIPSWGDRFPMLRLCGLMTMAPNIEAENCRPIFKRLRELREELRQQLANPEQAEDFSELSMGMSNDYKVAAEEGATLIRLGQALYATP